MNTHKNFLFFFILISLTLISLVSSQQMSQVNVNNLTTDSYGNLPKVVIIPTQLSPYFCFANGLNVTGDYCVPLSSSTTYYPNTTITTGGTNTTSNISYMWYYDSMTYNVSEGNGANPLTLYINYTNVNTFSQWILREFYTGSSSHNIQFELYDYNTGTWESYFSITGQSGMTWITIPVYDPTNHIGTGANLGIVQTRLRHVENGISSHRLYVDVAWLLNGNNIGASTNLAGYAKYNFTSNNFMGNGSFQTTGNITATYFCNWTGSCFSLTDLNQTITIVNSNTSTDFYRSAGGAEIATRRMYNGNYVYDGMAVNPKVNGTLMLTQFSLKKSGSPTGNAYSFIYRATGLYGYTMTPTGSPIAISQPIDVSTLTTSFVTRTFTFNSSNQIRLNQSNFYVAVVSYTGGDAANYVAVGGDSSGNSSVSNPSYSTDGTSWSFPSTLDFTFYVNVTELTIDLTNNVLSIQKATNYSSGLFDYYDYQTFRNMINFFCPSGTLYTGIFSNGTAVCNVSTRVFNSTYNNLLNQTAPTAVAPNFYAVNGSQANGTFTYKLVNQNFTNKSYVDSTFYPYTNPFGFINYSYWNRINTTLITTTPFDYVFLNNTLSIFTNGGCQGSIENNCSFYDNQVDCEANNNHGQQCFWEDVCGGNLDCSIYNDQTSCDAKNPYCQSNEDFFCEGTAECSALSEVDCINSDPICQANYNGDCTLEPYPDCLSLSGCTDAGDHCEGSYYTSCSINLGCAADTPPCGMQGCSQTFGFVSCSNNLTCNDISPLSCTDYNGCSLSPICLGTATCGGFTGMNECDSENFCFWNYTNPHIVLGVTQNQTTSTITYDSVNVLINTTNTGSVIITNGTSFGTVVAGSFITMTEVNNESNPLESFKLGETLFYTNGSINHDALDCSKLIPVKDYSKPQSRMQCDKDGKKCKEVTDYEIVYIKGQDQTCVTAKIYQTLAKINQAVSVIGNDTIDVTTDIMADNFYTKSKTINTSKKYLKDFDENLLSDKSTHYAMEIKQNITGDNIQVLNVEDRLVECEGAIADIRQCILNWDGKKETLQACIGGN